MAKQIDFCKIASTNPAVDAKKIEQLQSYRALMEKAGLSEKPNYRISPPLGPFRSKPVRTNILGILKVRVF